MEFQQEHSLNVFSITLFLKVCVHVLLTHMLWLCFDFKPSFSLGVCVGVYVCVHAFFGVLGGPGSNLGVCLHPISTGSVLQCQCSKCNELCMQGGMKLLEDCACAHEHVPTHGEMCVKHISLSIYIYI